MTIGFTFVTSTRRALRSFFFHPLPANFKRAVVRESGSYKAGLSRTRKNTVQVDFPSHKGTPSQTFTVTLPVQRFTFSKRGTRPLQYTGSRLWEIYLPTSSAAPSPHSRHSDVAPLIGNHLARRLPPSKHAITLQSHSSLYSTYNSSIAVVIIRSIGHVTVSPNLARPQRVAFHHYGAQLYTGLLPLSAAISDHLYRGAARPEAVLYAAVQARQSPGIGPPPQSQSQPQPTPQ